VEDIQSIVGTLKDKNIGVIITDHNVDETLAITDRTYLLYEGKILKTGTAEDLANDEMVRKVYLGSNFELRTSPQMARQRKEREEREREEALRALGHVSEPAEEDEEENDDM
jgi:lipopolysaccharide export system ATP-binding protein